jgi:hypothetical protein
VIVAKIELWPNGDEKAARLLQVVTITNDGTGTAEAGNYNVEVSHQIGTKYLPNGLTGDPDRDVWKRGQVYGYRRRLGSAVGLLHRALSSALGSRS